MNHLMIDLETMGNKPNAPIVSIGAVFFEPSTGKLGEEFYRVVSLKSAVDGGAVPDPETIIWWMQQSEEARMAICDKDAAMNLVTALSDLNCFIRDNAEPEKVQVWGNGATFDNVILRASYEREFVPTYGNSGMIVMLEPSSNWDVLLVSTRAVIFRLTAICIMRLMTPNTRLNTSL